MTFEHLEIHSHVETIAIGISDYFVFPDCSVTVINSNLKLRDISVECGVDTLLMQFGSLPGSLPQTHETVIHITAIEHELLTAQFNQYFFLTIYVVNQSLFGVFRIESECESQPYQPWCKDLIGT